MLHAAPIVYERERDIHSCRGFLILSLSQNHKKSNIWALPTTRPQAVVFLHNSFSDASAQSLWRCSCSFGFGPSCTAAPRGRDTDRSNGFSTANSRSNIHHGKHGSRTRSRSFNHRRECSNLAQHSRHSNLSPHRHLNANCDCGAIRVISRSFGYNELSSTSVLHISYEHLCRVYVILHIPEWVSSLLFYTNIFFSRYVKLPIYGNY